MAAKKRVESKYYSNVTPHGPDFIPFSIKVGGRIANVIYDKLDSFWKGVNKDERAREQQKVYRVNTVVQRCLSPSNTYTTSKFVPAVSESRWLQLPR